jgi:hypothetical protein
MLKFKILKYLPPYGPLPEQFTNGPRMYREGFTVEFYPENGEKWVGNFQLGLGGISQGGYGVNDVFKHPNGRNLIVVAGGQAYIVDPETRELMDTFGGQIEYVAEVTELQEIVFGNGLELKAIGTEGLRWKTPRLSWDGMRSVIRVGTKLSGESYNPLSDSWAPFSVDLINGNTEGGSYFEDDRYE